MFFMPWKLRCDWYRLHIFCQFVLLLRFLLFNLIFYVFWVYLIYFRRIFGAWLIIGEVWSLLGDFSLHLDNFEVIRKLREDFDRKWFFIFNAQRGTINFIKSNKNLIILSKKKITKWLLDLFIFVYFVFSPLVLFLCKKP